MAALPLLGAAAIAAWALYKERKDKDERARTAPPGAFPAQPLMPGADRYLPYFVQFAGNVPQSVINAAANVLQARNPVAAATLARNLDALGYAPIASIIRTAAATWTSAAAGARELRARRLAASAGADPFGDAYTATAGRQRLDQRRRRLVRQC